MDCIDLLNHFDYVLVIFIHRFANGITQSLTKATYSISSSREWHDNAPDSIHHALISEEFEVMQV